MIVYDEFKTQESLDIYLRHICKEVVASYPLALLKNKIPSFKWDVCVDMGANVGAFSILASNHFNNVYAFEPGYLACLNAKHNAHYICKK